MHMIAREEAWAFDREIRSARTSAREEVKAFDREIRSTRALSRDR
jgi:hypothetical protein